MRQQGILRDNISSLSEKVVLVGVLNRLKDLKIASCLRWYRIPVKKCPKRPIEYVAFYQTSRFGSEGKSIRSYAKVLGRNKVKRNVLLPDEPLHPRAEEFYYKFRLSHLTSLPEPITNQSRRRVSFAFTTLNRLLNSKELSQVFDIPPLEELLSVELSRLKIPFQKEFGIYKNQRPLYRLDLAILCNSGKLAIECDSEKWHSLPMQKKKDRRRDNYLRKKGWRVLHFSGKEISNHLTKCGKIILYQIQKLNGVKKI